MAGTLGKLDDSVPTRNPPRMSQRRVSQIQGMAQSRPPVQDWRAIRRFFSFSTLRRGRRRTSMKLFIASRAFRRLRLFL